MLDIQFKNGLSRALKFKAPKDKASVSSSFSQLQEAVQNHDGYFEEMSLAYRIAKRGLDIFVAIVGLFVLILFLPIVALLIFCEDRGPIFYHHERVGRYGCPFSTYKFRSMVVDADSYFIKYPELSEAWKKLGKLENDPRITRVGRLLRRTSIDELPQFFNVLRGEMSLVGPRAIQLKEVDRFGERFEMRQKVKPGLTGLWQVSGRSMTDYEHRAILDYFYVMERSFWMDLFILLRTIPTVIHGIGAY